MRNAFETPLVLFCRFCCFCCSAVFHPAAALVKGRVAGVEILAVQMLLRDAEGVGETINMKHYCSFRIFS